MGERQVPRNALYVPLGTTAEIMITNVESVTEGAFQAQKEANGASDALRPAVVLLLVQLLSS